MKTAARGEHSTNRDNRYQENHDFTSSVLTPVLAGTFPTQQETDHRESVPFVSEAS
jgi:hypothetical protein